MDLCKEERQQGPHRQTHCHTQQNGHRDVDKTEQRGTFPLHHAHKGGEQNNDVHVIHRRPCKDQLRDALLYAVALVHEPDHPRHHHRRGNCRQHRTQDRRLQKRQPHELRCQQKHPHQLKRRRNKAHQNGRPPQFFQPGSIQSQPCTGENDDQGHLPQLRGDTQNAAVQQVQDVRPQYHTGCQHPQQARQPALLAKPPHEHPNDQNQRNTQ